MASQLLTPSVHVGYWQVKMRGQGMDERRTSRRIPVTFRASFARVSFGTGEGTIVDLGVGGCRVESVTLVPVTTYLELRLEVSLMGPPILVDLATVRWVRDRQLGLEFLSLRPEHQARLLCIIEQAHSSDQG
jgi:hypothetical protein